MQRIGDFAGKALRRMACRGEAFEWLRASWASVVGKRIAAQSIPGNLRDGVLEIYVADRDWREQLEAMGNVLRDRINRAWGSALVRELKLQRPPKIGPQKARLELEQDVEHTPFVRSRARRPRTGSGSK